MKSSAIFLKNYYEICMHGRYDRGEICKVHTIPTFKHHYIRIIIFDLFNDNYFAIKNCKDYYSEIVVLKSRNCRSSVGISQPWIVEFHKNKKV